MTRCHRDVILRLQGFEDPFKGVKYEENRKALQLLPGVLAQLDSQPSLRQRLESAVKGVMAGNIFDLGAAASSDLFNSEGVRAVLAFQCNVPHCPSGWCSMAESLRCLPYMHGIDQPQAHLRPWCAWPGGERKDKRGGGSVAPHDGMP